MLYDAEQSIAACHAPIYTPDRHAAIVRRFMDAGAMFVGRFSVNQPAIGHVGVRQPYGVPVTPFHVGHVPGDSTSGNGGGGGGGRAGGAERCGQV